jgi:hypothetical protein
MIALNLGTTTGTFPGEVPARQCAHHSDALQWITFRSQGYFLMRT